MVCLLRRHVIKINLIIFVVNYLLILDRTNWRTNMLTSLLVPYIYLTLALRNFEPSSYLIHGCFDFDSGEISGNGSLWSESYCVSSSVNIIQNTWSCPALCSYWLWYLPRFISSYVRSGWIGVILCLGAGCCLLQEYIRASGGFKWIDKTASFKFQFVCF
ncbi:hypothetical protein LXL04_029089 [Taraxacum kok-saghyz]